MSLAQHFWGDSYFKISQAKVCHFHLDCCYSVFLSKHVGDCMTKSSYMSNLKNNISPLNGGIRLFLDCFHWYSFIGLLRFFFTERSSEAITSHVLLTFQSSIQLPAVFTVCFCRFFNEDSSYALFANSSKSIHENNTGICSWNISWLKRTQTRLFN